jgi:hypothetical protein
MIAPPQVFAAGITLKGIRLLFTLLLLTALAIGLAIQTARLEGFKVWPLSMTGWIEIAGARQTTIEDMIAAQERAADQARAARVQHEKTYREIAERIDENATDQLEAALAAADRFVAAGGMRAEAGRNTRCATRTGAEDNAAENSAAAGRTPQLDARNAGQPAGLEGAAGTAESLVLVPAADIRLCTINTIKAEAGRDLALQLEAESKKKSEQGSPQ